MFERSAAAPLELSSRKGVHERGRGRARCMDKRAMELTLARMAKDFLPYSIDQRLLLPPDMRDWLPEAFGAVCRRPG